jgi:transcriptional regulator with XRE-family HTH domain
MDVRKSVGDNIRGFRHKLGYTLEKLAVLSGLNINYISSVERGERNIGILNVVKLAKALKIAPHLLLVPESYREDPK